MRALEPAASVQTLMLCFTQVMRHCLFYLVLYGVMLGLLSAGYANYQYLSTPFAERKVIAHFTAALTSGRPVFGFLGWALINVVGERPCCYRAGPSKTTPFRQRLGQVRVQLFARTSNQ